MKLPALPSDLCVAERKVTIDETWEWEALESLFGDEELSEIRHGGDDTPDQKFKFELTIGRVTK